MTKTGRKQTIIGLQSMCNPHFQPLNFIVFLEFEKCNSYLAKTEIDSMTEQWKACFM